MATTVQRRKAAPKRAELVSKPVTPITPMVKDECTKDEAIIATIPSQNRMVEQPSGPIKVDGLASEAPIQPTSHQLPALQPEPDTASEKANIDQPVSTPPSIPSTGGLDKTMVPQPLAPQLPKLSDRPPYQTRPILLSLLQDVLKPIKGKRLPKAASSDPDGYKVKLEEAFRKSDEGQQYIYHSPCTTPHARGESTPGWYESTAHITESTIDHSIVTTHENITADCDEPSIVPKADANHTLRSAYLYIVESKLMGLAPTLLDSLLDLVFAVAPIPTATLPPSPWQVGLILGLQGNVSVSIRLEPSTVGYLLRETTYTLRDFHAMNAVAPHVGRTIAADTLIAQLEAGSISRSMLPPGTPVQTFFMGTQCAHGTSNPNPASSLGSGPNEDTGTKGDISADETAPALSRRQKRITALTRLKESAAPNLRLYVHGPLDKNICRANTNLNTTLIDLRAAVKMGARGLIVHCGSNKMGLPLKAAIEGMLFNWRKLLVVATQECPLLIENSAAEGSDICCDPTSIARIYLAFRPQERERVGLCIDTQHAYSAGYDPLEYLVHVHSMVGEGVIKLVHYNDSSTERGAHHDHHGPIAGGWGAIAKAVAGNVTKSMSTPTTEALPIPQRPSAARGFIGLRKMASIARFCIDHGIDMVTEW